jgi:hypothetical protein
VAQTTQLPVKAASKHCQIVATVANERAGFGGVPLMECGDVEFGNLNTSMIGNRLILLKFSAAFRASGSRQG